MLRKILIGVLICLIIVGVGTTTLAIGTIVKEGQRQQKELNEMYESYKQTETQKYYDTMNEINKLLK